MIVGPPCESWRDRCTGGVPERLTTYTMGECFQGHEDRETRRATWVALLVQRYLSNTANRICYIIRRFWIKRKINARSKTTRHESQPPFPQSSMNLGGAGSKTTLRSYLSGRVFILQTPVLMIVIVRSGTGAAWRGAHVGFAEGPPWFYFQWLCVYLYLVHHILMFCVYHVIHI